MVDEQGRGPNAKRKADEAEVNDDDVIGVVRSRQKLTNQEVVRISPRRGKLSPALWFYTIAPCLHLWWRILLSLAKVCEISTCL